MSSKRLYFVLIGTIGILFIALVAGAYGTNKILTTKSDKLVSLKAKDQALTQEQASLTKAKKDLGTYTDLQKIADSVVPEDKNQAEAVREIVNIAADNNVTLSNVTFPASTLGTATTGAKSSSGATVAPKTSANNKANGLSQLTPVPNIPGVYELPITIVSEPTKPVAYDKFISFLSALEHNRRTAQVGNISITPNPNDRTRLSFSLSLNEYIKP